MATAKSITNTVCELIAEGKLDDHLETIMAECNARRREVRDQTTRRNMRDLNELGKRVRITGSVRPKYLLGYVGTVIERPEAFFRNKPGLIYVDLGTTVGTGRRQFGPVVGVPASCLEECNA